MHPFVALMRKYCIDYTNSHDQSLYDEFMHPDYVVHSFGMDLPRDTMYSPGVKMIFETAPGLGLVVHEFVLNGDRLAMHFSEHAAMPANDDGRALACWRGIGLYRWDGQRLLENWVEQDYFAMQRQVEAGEPDPLIPPHLDPWMWTEPVPADDTAESVVRAWLDKGDLADAAHVHVDDMRTGATYEPVLDIDRVVIDDIFSAGRSVPFHVTFEGSYRGGLGSALDVQVGESAAMGVAGIARVERGIVVDVDAVTCRIQAVGALTGGLNLGF